MNIVLTLTMYCFLLISCTNSEQRDSQSGTYDGFDNQTNNLRPGTTASSVDKTEIGSISNINNTLIAYGFVRGQQISIRRITQLYPELEKSAKLAEMQFDLVFNAGFTRIKSEIKEKYGEIYLLEVDKKLETEFEALQNMNFSKKMAIDFVEEVKMRSQGKIASPVLEILTHYQFVNSPAEELLEGFYADYTTLENKKAKGLELSLKHPISWIAMEAERPNIPQKFISKFGQGFQTIMVVVKTFDLADGETIPDDELEAFFTTNGLKELVPSGGVYHLSEQIKIDGQLGGVLEYSLTEKRIDQTIKTRCISYMTVYEKWFIQLQCYVYASSEEKLNTEMSRNKRLFRLVANSLVIQNRYY